jgi:hypothetical protein
LGESGIVPDADAFHAHAAGDYMPNDWTENPSGQGYLERLSATGRPHLERRAAELLATLGPRISAVEEAFAKSHGWTPNRESRIWEHPSFQGYQRDLIPAPPQPWLERPSNTGDRPISSFLGMPPPGLLSE